MLITTIYGQKVDTDIICSTLDRITNQIFRLLPWREEEEDWIKPLETLIIELSGIGSLFPQQETIFNLISKLQGLKNQGEDSDFLLFRRCIFECCSLTAIVKTELTNLGEVENVTGESE